jgi:hypothetical protein
MIARKLAATLNLRMNESFWVIFDLPRRLARCSSMRCASSDRSVMSFEATRSKPIMIDCWRLAIRLPRSCRVLFAPAAGNILHFLSMYIMIAKWRAYYDELLHETKQKHDICITGSTHRGLRGCMQRAAASVRTSSSAVCSPASYTNFVHHRLVSS